MKHDVNLRLTRRQFDLMKEYADLDVALKQELPQSKMKKIAVYLRDPDYDVHLVMPHKDKGPYLRFRLSKPRIFVPMPNALAKALRRCSRQMGITDNQFINIAIQEGLKRPDGEVVAMMKKTVSSAPNFSPTKRARMPQDEFRRDNPRETSDRPLQGRCTARIRPLRAKIKPVI